MPWVKVGKNRYKSKSGREWTIEQIRAYKAKERAKKNKGIKSNLRG